VESGRLRLRRSNRGEDGRELIRTPRGGLERLRCNDGPCPLRSITHGARTSASAWSRSPAGQVAATAHRKLSKNHQQHRYHRHLRCPEPARLYRLVCDAAPSGDWFRINQQVPANPDDILPVALSNFPCRRLYPAYTGVNMARLCIPS